MVRGEERVREYVRRSRINAEIIEFDGSTKSSELAAKALGCSVAQIAKSVVFKTAQALVVVISGDRRVDAAKLSRLVGHEAVAATADEVKDLTGYPAGGVPPFPHHDNIRLLVDSSLARFGQVWAAAGRPNSVMRLATTDLLAAVDGAFVDVSTEKAN